MTDPDAWFSSNRAVLHPGKVQDWTFAVRSEVAASDRQIETVLRRIVDQLIPGSGDFRLVETSASLLRPKHPYQRREDLPMGPIPTLADTEQVIYARGQFASRSPLLNVPWVARNVTSGFSLSDAISDADVILLEVGQAVGDAGPEPTFFEDLTDTVTDVIPDTPKEALTWGVVIAMGAGLWYVFRKGKR